MKRLSVISSYVASVGHDSEEKILEVELVDNAVYQYKGVSEDIYISLLRADSHKKYITSNINGRYRQTKVS